METSLQAVTDEAPAEKPPVRQLTRAQRRVLGVLVEKAFTTPEYYPLTLKAVTAGCNQKSNRSPVTNYSEDTIEETLDELRQLGLAAVVHTESGRTERYRHFMRQRYPFTEPQLAVITELLLRGAQQLGELRSRASRMVPIESLEELRSDLQQLTDQGYVRTSGPLDRRGIEVDHGFHEGDETPLWSGAAVGGVETTSPDASSTTGGHRTSLGRNATEPQPGTSELFAELSELRQEFAAISERVTQLADELADLRRDLGA